MESGASSITGIYSKKLSVPMLINYRYIERPDLPALVIKITKPQGNTIKFIDENKKEITPEEVDESGDIIRFSSPQFKEINVVFTKTQTPSPTLTQTLTITAAPTENQILSVTARQTIKENAETNWTLIGGSIILLILLGVVLLRRSKTGKR